MISPKWSNVFVEVELPGLRLVILASLGSLYGDPSLSRKEVSASQIIPNS